MVWDLGAPQPELRLFHSAADTWRASGTTLADLTESTRVFYGPEPVAGNWLEAIVPDKGGVLYGWYHNEPPVPHVCPGDTRTQPQIGAVRSTDGGATWENLGIVIAPRLRPNCHSNNKYFVGGVGDFTVALDPEERWLYVFFSMYGASRDQQGIAFARLAWEDRDRPVGRFQWWARAAWYWGAQAGWRRSATPIATLGPAGSWHDATREVMAFWGPAVHWNTHLRQYVMLLNRSRDAQFNQEGIYISYAPSLEDPAAWSVPERLLDGGPWYPQVVGSEAELGTDRIAGRRARLFVGGSSQWFIDFSDELDPGVDQAWRGDPADAVASQ